MSDAADTLLSEREQDRLDRLLFGARLFFLASFGVAGLSTVLQTASRPGGWLEPLREPLTVVAVLVVIALAMAGDRLFRLAHPWLELDPRRVPYGWILAGNARGAWLRGTLALLAPVALTAWATGLGLHSVIAQLTGVVAAVLLAISPRVIEYHLGLLRQRAQQPRQETRFSGWILCWLSLARSVTFAAAVLLILLATAPAWTYRVGDAVALVILIFITLLLVHLLLLLLATGIDQLGARFHFATHESLHPAAQLIGKTVGDALDAYNLTHEALSFFDKPRGKLLMVSFAARIDAEPVQVRLYLKYNAKRLFSVDRNWHPDAVRSAEVSSVEADYRTGPKVTSS